MNVPFVDLHRQYLRYKDELDAAMARVITETAFISGSYAQKFEEEFAAWLGVKHVIGCANGTDALEIMLDALEVGPGDEVLVPAMTWISTAEAVGTRGAKAIFIDIDDTATMDPDLIEPAITERTKGIIPVHLYGCPADMPRIMGIAKRRGLFVLEDCAQAHGARIDGKKVGTWGHAATFSFYPGKNLGAYGDAGGMASNDAALAEKARIIANHGQPKKHTHLIEGRNSRLDGLQAAILSVKLRYLDTWSGERQTHAAAYDAAFANSGLRLTLRPENRTSVHHLYVVQHPQREQLAHSLKQIGIQTAVHYPHALPTMPCYGTWNADANNTHPNAVRIGKEALSIPMFPELTPEERGYVIQQLQNQ
ncbi:DegT/DnrJ/EryC1/StrS family aminotransferase [Flavobacteriales bacterium]|nr:DegT/DnrJ/EryC1/StrS family aminotransferase [Flavobacteriales bacterium]